MMPHNQCVKFILGFICVLHLLQSDFIAVSTVVALGANIICNKIPGLAPRQRNICRRRPGAIVAIGKGAALGMKECRRQFHGTRWNCSQLHASPYMFINYHTIACREAAFSYAVNTAGVTYAVTRACSRGNSSYCGCDRSKRDGRYSKNGWQWGGCSADIRYGLKIARKFLDAREIRENARSLMNLHNNRAGRKAVQKNMRTECKCHGVSGSCQVKTCWTRLPHFTKIGDYLKRKYRKAKFVVPIKGSRARRAKFLQLKRSRRPHRKPRRSDLVFLHKSPNYCERDVKSGTLGTSGRQCNKTSKYTDSCGLLCCGRGYNTHAFERTWKCHCKFHWCCYVSCETCKQSTEEYTCK